MILVADDDRAIRTVLTQALVREGYDVRTTSTAAGLWRWVADGQGQLVITDVVMPDENGLDLVPRIRKLRPDLRVIVMSAQNTLMTAVKATERGAFEYLPKPFDLKDLISIVERALAEPAPKPDELIGFRARRRDAPDHWPFAGDAGDLPHYGAADEHRPDGDDSGRIGHRQGADRTGAARIRQASRRSIRRGQYGGDPAGIDRKRAVRPRTRRVHRRSQPPDRPVRNRLRAARCSSTRSAICRPRPRRGFCGFSKTANM